MGSWVARGIGSWIAAALFWIAASMPAHSQPAPGGEANFPGTITLQVDATDLDRRIVRVRQALPVRPGRLTLQYPRWLPGMHGPFGAVHRLAGLVVRQGEATLAWQRDTTDPFAFHVDVPSPASELQLSFDLLTSLGPQGGRVTVTREMLNLQWHAVVLYPAGYAARRVTVQPTLVFPAQWRQASALSVEHEELGATATRVRFAATDLETLVDSPVFAGAHLKRYELDPPGAARPVRLHLMADNPSLLKPSDEQIEAHRRLVQQSDKLFGSRHFRRYDFLLALSKELGGIGLEHHESSENAVPTDYFKDWPKHAGQRALLPHEYVHSWNGKFRRPADLLTRHFNEPMRNSLLWIYEGQTQFWGWVLAARSGLITPEQARQDLADVAANQSAANGRQWRALQDTTNEGTIGPGTRQRDWWSWQRGGNDYYDEATLIWLDVDMLMRAESGEQSSLDGFARAFFGVEDGRVEPLPYGFDDVVRTLAAVHAHDWRGFLRVRLDALGPAPLAGIERSGWRLAFADTPSELARRDRDRPTHDHRHSIGLVAEGDGKLQAVMWGSPAFDAGLTSAMQVMAIGGRSFSPERLAEAIKANTKGERPVELLVREDDRWRSVRIDYRGGLRYPRLERIEGRPDRLSALLAPR
jgi:predicted metalloprotease with PDZ domain